MDLASSGNLNVDNAQIAVRCGEVTAIIFTDF